MRKKLKRIILKTGIVGIVAFAILPIGTPEDLIVTIPLIIVLGWIGYSILVGIVLLALIIGLWKNNGKK